VQPISQVTSCKLHGLKNAPHFFSTLFIPKKTSSLKWKILSQITAMSLIVRKCKCHQASLLNKKLSDLEVGFFVLTLPINPVLKNEQVKDSIYFCNPLRKLLQVVKFKALTWEMSRASISLDSLDTIAIQVKSCKRRAKDIIWTRTVR